MRGVVREGLRVPIPLGTSVYQAIGTDSNPPRVGEDERVRVARTRYADRNARDASRLSITAHLVLTGGMVIRGGFPVVLLGNGVTAVQADS